MAYSHPNKTKTTPITFKLGKVCQKRDLDPQPKIDSYFQIEEPPKKKAKRGKKQVAKNFQEYALNKCRFRKTVGKSCYMPKKYGIGHPPGFLDGSRFCGSCYLEPCFLVERKDDISKTARDIVDDNRREIPGFLYMSKQESNDIINADLKAELKSVLEDIFSKRYVRKAGLPLCAKWVVDREDPPSVRLLTPVKKKVVLFPCVQETEDPAPSGDEDLNVDWLRKRLT
jgi:hypothetical protein